MTWEQKGWIMFVLFQLSFIGNLFAAAYISGLKKQMKWQKMLMHCLERENLK